MKTLFGEQPEEPKGLTTFEEFWAAYPSGPRRVGKPQCKNKFAKLSAEENAKIMPSLEMYKISEEWTKGGGMYVPTPHKWLNQAYYDAKLGVAMPKKIKNKINPVTKQLTRDMADALDPRIIQQKEEESQLRELGSSGKLKGVVHQAINEIKDLYDTNPLALAKMHNQLEKSVNGMLYNYPQIRKQVLIILARTAP